MRNPFKRNPDPFSPTAFGGGQPFRSVRTRERKHMRHKWQWWTLIVVVLIAGGAGFAVWRYFNVQGNVHVPLPLPQEGEGEPFNVLLVGSDSRGDLTAQEQDDLGALAVEGARADTLILGHVDPADDRVIMLQFPRDLYVPIAGTGQERKINEALLFGRKALVGTVEDLLGITINRYVEINIAGFRDVVDAIGGVEVCVPEQIPFDPQTGLEVQEPGTIEFDGDSALRFVRSRAFESGDFERIANQQKFLSAALDKVTSVGTLLQPKRVLDLIGVAEKNLRIDFNTSLTRLKGILDRFRSFEPDRYEAYIAPNLGSDNVTLPSGEPYSIVVADVPKIKLIGEAIADNESPAEADGVPSIAPNTIRVGVYNGVDLYDDYASEAAAALVAATGGDEAGVQIAETANAPHFRFKETLIRYEPRAEAMARLVAATLPGARLEGRGTPDSTDVAVIVGTKRFRTEPLLQVLPIPLPKPGAEPKVCEEEGKLGPSQR